MAKQKLDYKDFDASSLNAETRRALGAVHALITKRAELCKPINAEIKEAAGRFEALFFKQAEAAKLEIDPALTTFGYNFGKLAIARKPAPSAKKGALSF